MIEPIDKVTPRVKEYAEAVKARGSQEDINACAIAVGWMILATQVEHPSTNPLLMMVQRKMNMHQITDLITRIHSEEWVEKHLKPVSDLFHRDLGEYLARKKAERGG